MDEDVLQKAITERMALRRPPLSRGGRALDVAVALGGMCFFASVVMLLL